MTSTTRSGIERRLFPRMAAGFKVKITIKVNGENCEFESSAADISVVAMQLAGTSEIVRCFQDQNTLPRTCSLSFTLPGTNSELDLPCQLVNYRRLSQHAYAIVLGYAGADVELRDRIKAWIASKL